MAITSDWHIHTHCSCDSASMTFENLVKDAEKIGITDFGVSDHFHTRVQTDDIAASRSEYEKTIEKYPHLKGHFHFGIEATIVSKWEVDKIIKGDFIPDRETPTYGVRCGGPSGAELTLDFDDEFLNKYGIDYVIAGMHWPMYCKTDNESVKAEYHRQYMFAITHPYTTIMAHYLWWDEGLFKNLWGVKDAVNPFFPFSSVSETMRSEIKAALLECNTAFELNGYLFGPEIPNDLRTGYLDEYLGYAADLQHSGVVLSMGSDSHRPHLTDFDYEYADKLFKKYKINTSAFFKL